MVEILLHWKCSSYTYASNINSFYHPTCQWDLENPSASAKHKDPPGITLIPTHSKQNSRLQTWECMLESAKHPWREESREDAHLEPKLRIGLPVIAKDGPIEVTHMLCRCSNLLLEAMSMAIYWKCLKCMLENLTEWWGQKRQHQPSSPCSSFKVTISPSIATPHAHVCILTKNSEYRASNWSSHECVAVQNHHKEKFTHHILGSWSVCQNLFLQICSSRYGNNFFRQKLKRSACL